MIQSNLIVNILDPCLLHKHAILFSNYIFYIIKVYFSILAPTIKKKLNNHFFMRSIVYIKTYLEFFKDNFAVK